MLSQQCKVTPEATDGFELMIETHEGGKLFLIGVDLVNEFVSQN